jgi:hypothetical protein
MIEIHFMGHRHFRRSRKGRECMWCGEDIYIGDPYTRFQGKDDEGWFRFPMHPACAAAWEERDFLEFRPHCEERPPAPEPPPPTGVQIRAELETRGQLRLPLGGREAISL